MYKLYNSYFVFLGNWGKIVNFVILGFCIFIFVVLRYGSLSYALFRNNANITWHERAVLASGALSLLRNCRRVNVALLALARKDMRKALRKGFWQRRNEQFYIYCNIYIYIHIYIYIYIYIYNLHIYILIFINIFIYSFIKLFIYSQNSIPLYYGTVAFRMPFFATTPT